MKKLLSKFKLLYIFLAFAALKVDNPAEGVFTTKFGTDFKTIITSLVNLFLGFIGIICIAYIIWGGYLVATSRGNAETAGQGKKTVTNAIIGLLIIILSYAIVSIITNAAFGNVGGPLPSRNLPSTVNTPNITPSAGMAPTPNPIDSGVDSSNR